MKNQLKTPLLLALASVLLTGCASIQNSYDGHDLSRIDPYVEKNKTTYREMRALLGTPTITGTTKDGDFVAGWALVGNRPGGAYGRNVGKHMMTLGFGSKTEEATAKNVVVRFADDGTVADLRKSGWSYLHKWRVTHWLECERPLTEAELNKPLIYTVDEICEIYATEVAAKENLPVDEVDIGKETEWCNLPCHTRRDAEAAYGPLENYDDLVDEEEGDGARFAEIFPR